MIQFKPSEFRVIAILSILALAGSILIVIQRYEKAARFNVAIPGINAEYNYRYNSAELSLTDSKSDSAGRTRLLELGAVSAVEKIDINNSGYYDFEALPGIGPALAERIIAYRDSIGGFKSVDDLLNVTGIGPVKLSLIRERVEAK